MKIGHLSWFLGLNFKIWPVVEWFLRNFLWSETWFCWI